MADGALEADLEEAEPDLEAGSRAEDAALRVRLPEGQLVQYQPSEEEGQLEVVLDPPEADQREGEVNRSPELHRVEVERSTDLHAVEVDRSTDLHSLSGIRLLGEAALIQQEVLLDGFVVLKLEEGIERRSDYINMEDHGNSKNKNSDDLCTAEFTIKNDQSTPEYRNTNVHGTAEYTNADDLGTTTFRNRDDLCAAEFRNTDDHGTAEYRNTDDLDLSTAEYRDDTGDQCRTAKVQGANCEPAQDDEKTVRIKEDPLILQSNGETEEEGWDAEDRGGLDPVNKLEDVHKYLLRDPTVHSQVLYHISLGKFLKVTPVKTDPVLVDDPGVRLNVFTRDERIFGETLSLSRKCVKKRRLKSLIDVEQLVRDLLNRYQYCQGAPTEYTRQLRKRVGKSDLKLILISEYNNNTIIRSSKCKLVIDKETEGENSFRCQSCQTLTNHLIQKYVIPDLFRKESKDALVSAESEGVRREVVPEAAVLEPTVILSIPSQQASRSSIKTESEGNIRSWESVEEPPGEEEDPTDESYDMDEGHQRVGLKRKRTLSPKYASKIFRCLEFDCYEEFSSRQSFRAHTLIHNPSKEEKKEVECKDCGNKFANKRDLEIHNKTHTGNAKRSQCNECDKKFKTIGAMKIHKRSMHNDHKSYLCFDCGASFKGASALIDHRKRIHLHVKQHTCEFCSKEFFSKKDYSDHTRTHTGEKPYQCPSCGKCFARSYHLKRHTESVHRFIGVESSDILQNIAQDGSVLVQMGTTQKKPKRNKGKSRKVVASLPVAETISNISQDRLKSTGELVKHNIPLNLAVVDQQPRLGDNLENRNLFLQKHPNILQRLQDKQIGIFDEVDLEVENAQHLPVGSGDPMLEDRIGQQRRKGGIFTKPPRDSRGEKETSKHRLDLEKTEQSWIFYDN